MKFDRIWFEIKSWIRIVLSDIFLFIFKAFLIALEWTLIIIFTFWLLVLAHLFIDWLFGFNCYTESNNIYEFVLPFLKNIGN